MLDVLDVEHLVGVGQRGERGESISAHLSHREPLSWRSGGLVGYELWSVPHVQPHSLLDHVPQSSLLLHLIVRPREGHTSGEKKEKGVIFTIAL